MGHRIKSNVNPVSFMISKVNYITISLRFKLPN